MSYFDDGMADLMLYKFKKYLGSVSREIQNRRLKTMDINFAPQGWQCPICKRVYSPTTPMCNYCGGEQKTVTTTSTGSVPFDILNSRTAKDWND